jgi:hypothetical protein
MSGMLALGATQMATVNERGPPSTELSGPESGVGRRDHHPQLPHSRLLEQLKRRNVFRVAALYLAVCWLILEPVHVVFNMLHVRCGRISWCLC